MARRNSSEEARRLGREVEPEVVEGLNRINPALLSARNAEPNEDLPRGFSKGGFDVEITLHINGATFTVKVDVTISTKRFLSKRASSHCRFGYVVPAVVRVGESPEEMAWEVLRQVIYSLAPGLAEEILRELTT